MRDRFSRLITALSRNIHERDDALRLGLLALLAGESLFLLGPPGTAKSLVARRLKSALAGARAFEYLMGRFSTPEEIFGPLSIAGLRDRDVFERRTAGYLPEADVAFLDEVWRASPPIQNTLLTILNEKRFRNGDHELTVPLKLLVAASNRAPSGEENAEAFWDRFVLRLEVAPLSTDEGFEALVTKTSDVYSADGLADALTSDEWRNLQVSIDTVTVPSEVVSALAALRRGLAEADLVVSDRRWKKASRLLRACAVAHGRAIVDGQDTGLLEHVLWDKPEHRATVVQQLTRVLQEYGWVSPEPLAEHEAAVDALRADLRALTLRERTETRPKPVLQDGEYFNLVGYPGDLSARVWAQDHSLLTAEELDGELFFFVPYGPFKHSQTHRLRATGGPAEIEVDGRLYALESRPEQVTVFDKIPPDGPRLKEWDSRAKALAERLTAARRHVDDELARRRGEAADHLFCVAYAEACGRGLEHDSADLGDLLVAVETLVETHDPD